MSQPNIWSHACLIIYFDGVFHLEIYNEWCDLSLKIIKGDDGGKEVRVEILVFKTYGLIELGDK